MFFYITRYEFMQNSKTSLYPQCGQSLGTYDIAICQSRKLVRQINPNLSNTYITILFTTNYLQIYRRYFHKILLYIPKKNEHFF